MSALGRIQIAAIGDTAEDLAEQALAAEAAGIECVWTPALVSPSPAMSAATAAVHRQSRIASAIRGSSSTTNACMPRATSWRISSAYRKPHTCWQHHAALTGGMTSSEPARTTTRPIPRILVHGLLAVIAAIAAARGYELLASSPSTAASPVDALRSEHRGLRGEHRGALGEHHGAPVLPSEYAGALGEADGAIPDGATVFDDEIPEIANLDPVLLGALGQAATDAAVEGVEFLVNSGWRSPEYQEQLLQEAVSEYGSEAEAGRWVATPETSPHVSGDAVDIGPSDAAAWLSEHGAAYGLCQIYGNEPWHFELRAEAIDQGCPPMYADPTQDPRMQQ
jgi:D-alanyl-D-alanine carboxypeptidase